jgi:hypothetical protein
MDGITLRDELEGCLIGAKKLKRDVLTLSVALVQQEGIALAADPLQDACSYLTDVLRILDALVPQVAAALAVKFAEELPGYPEKGETL